MKWTEAEKSLLLSLASNEKTTKEIMEKYNKKAKWKMFRKRSFHEIQHRITMFRKKGMMRR